MAAARVLVDRGGRRHVVGAERRRMPPGGSSGRGTAARREPQQPEEDPLNGFIGDIEDRTEENRVNHLEPALFFLLFLPPLLFLELDPREARLRAVQ
jgi:hypothetical protein